MTLSLTMPSAFVSCMPFMSVLLVIPAITILPKFPYRTTEGLTLTSKLSANWTIAKTISPELNIFPDLVFLIVPEFFHFLLLYLVKEPVILISLFKFLEYFNHFLNKGAISLSWILSYIL